MNMRFLLALCITACAATAALADEFEGKYEGLLYPVVRVTVGQGGGSGTIIYSDDRDEEGRYVSFAVTNHHVISRAIRVTKKWNSLKQRYEQVEERDRVKVEAFVYEGGTSIATTDYQADIVAHSEDHDIAVLRLYFPKKMDFVAPLLPVDKELRVFQKVYAVGCSLLHEPIATSGEITDLEDMIDNKPYTMCSADIIFGNSGGAVFAQMDGKWYFVGIPARVAVTRGAPITHMGWFVPIKRIRGWIDEQILHFLVDEKKTPKECFEERAKMINRKDGVDGDGGRGLQPYNYDGRNGRMAKPVMPEPVAPSEVLDID